MNQRNSVVLIIICVSLLISMASGLVIIPVCTEPDRQESPAISGDTIVWEDNRTGGWDIYMWDQVNFEQPVCTNPGGQMFPAISGDTIVWEDWRNWATTGCDIYKWDPVNFEQPVCTEQGDQTAPAISGDTIVWMDARNQATTGYDIYKWDPVNFEQPVCTDPGLQYYPAISGDTIVWMDARNSATTSEDIYKWDPVNFEQPVCTEPGIQMYPAISGDTIVWMDARNQATGWDIYMWDPVNFEQPVCTEQGEQMFPAISGDTIVWQDWCYGGTTKWDIYIAGIPPAADAGPDQEVLVNEIVLFDGSASYNPGYDIISYDWEFGNGATGSGISTSYVYSEPGIFIVNLTVTDDDGFSDIDDTTITVVTPNDAAEDTIDDIEDLDLPQGTEQSLIAQLNAAIANLNRGHPDIALKKLQDFIDKVQKERCITIPCDDADKLIAMAQRIIDSITG